MLRICLLPRWKQSSWPWPFSLSQWSTRLLARVAAPEPVSPLLSVRPPVVTILGHVDHGKTTLLDYLRRSSVAAHEAGGITQHIGAFSVKLSGGFLATFLDTPGHAAFSKMRERGARITDIAVLVIAVDDGIMAQTVESIRYAQAAAVPLLVAITKCDKPGANERIARIKEELLKYNVICEDYGGETQVVSVSGITGAGMDNLLESLLAQGELLELRADPGAPVKGTIIEARLKRGLGETATVIATAGTLRIGIWLVAEDAICRVRVMLDHAGRPVTEAAPAMPVEVAGWQSLPTVGATVQQTCNENEATQISTHYVAKREVAERAKAAIITSERERIHKLMWEEKQRAMSRDSKVPLRPFMSYDDFCDEGKAGKVIPILRLLIKSDVIGSQEAIAKVLEPLGRSNKVKLQLIGNLVGPLNESDIRLAKIAGARLICFNLRTPRSLAKAAVREGVLLNEYDIIYRLAEAVEEELLALVPAEYQETRVGSAKILQVFFMDGSQPVAGCRVDEGNLIKSKERLGSTDRYVLQLVREGEIIWTGCIQSMRHLKKEITSAGNGMECGVILEDCREHLLPGDQLVCIERTIIRSSL